MSDALNLKNNPSQIHFTKMNGSGNDFVIFDARNQDLQLSIEQIKKISNRNIIGCDQLIIIRNFEGVDCLMEIYNSDGSISGACGNATRCVASLLDGDEVKNKNGFIDIEKIIK